MDRGNGGKRMKVRLELDIGQEVEWLTHPTSNGYLHGIILQIGSSKAKIKVQSTKTGEWKEKWAELRCLREIEPPTNVA